MDMLYLRVRFGNPFILQGLIPIVVSCILSVMVGWFLVFDLIEEFRQQIVDKTVLSIVNKNQVSVDILRTMEIWCWRMIKQENWLLLRFWISWIARLNLMEINYLILILLCIKEDLWLSFWLIKTNMLVFIDIGKNN